MVKPLEEELSNTSLENSNQTSALTKSLALKETRVVNILRAAVLGVLLTTAVVVSTVVYMVTRGQEKQQFSISFEHSANQVVESFHSAVERNLAAAASLSTSITTHAQHSKQQFPFVTNENFELEGADLRAQSGSHYLYWAPLVSDDNREAWEDFAMQNRFQWSDSYHLETQYRLEQDEAYGYSANQDTEPSFQLPENPGLTIHDDGTNYHPRIWSNAGNGRSPPGDEAQGGGPYLPMWQQSPFPLSSHQFMNLNLAGVKLVSQDMLQTTATEKKAIMHLASTPLDGYNMYFDMVLKASQYRHDFDDLQRDTHTMISYPVFNNFEEDRELAGILLTGIYWKILFSNLLPSNAEGIIVVVHNSLNETFAYRIDGDQATNLGVGDPHEIYEKYSDMGVYTNVNSHLEERAGPENRAYKTVGLSDAVEYTIRVYPSQDTADSYLTYMPGLYTVVTLCVFLFSAALFLMYSYVVERRQKIMTQKVIENVNKAAETERELNEFLSHEIRNPLSAAISASTFVSAAVNDPEPLKDEETRNYVRSDIEVVNSSLNFINDFLRSMLDTYRAAGNQITVAMAPTDILQDILLPVAGILNTRLYNFDVVVDCPPNLVVKTDSIRLKQVILNLVRNATKFVEQGFLRMRADVVDNQVRLYVEDSGPGISPQKQKELFMKYQESLDLLSQGTGIGLNLSKKLMRIMNGDLWLDAKYDSGVDGYPGACFVVELRTAPIDIESIESALAMEGSDAFDIDSPLRRFGEHPNGALLVEKDSTPPPRPTSCSTEATEATTNEVKAHFPVLQDEDVELPESLSILFVDDDTVLRKLFMRAVKRTAPSSWNIQEASSGEVALQLCEEQKYDLIFLDQYMASVDKQLLGTETAEAMRTKGVESKICGLSANDLRDSFINAGADDFVLKPMPCKPIALKRILWRILYESHGSAYREMNEGKA